MSNVHTHINSEHPSLALMSCCHKEHVIDFEQIKEPESFNYIFMNTYSELMEGELDGNVVVVKTWSRGLSLDTNAKKKLVARVSDKLRGWMKASAHRNIAKAIGIAPGFSPLPALVMSKYKNGNILNYLQGNPKASVINLLCDVASALNYMHSRTPPITHGKIRASNILISDTGEACITDIGLGSIFLPGQLEMTTDTIQDARWTAPEVILHEGGELSYDRCAADVYRLGMTILEVYSGKIPYAHIRNPALVINAIVSGARPPKEACSAVVSNYIWNLMEQCWAHEADNRPAMNLVMVWLESLAGLEIAERMITSFKSPFVMQKLQLTIRI
ncbi:kinase-like domain-containing protein [Cyathus striatus]|nr:kinase-like domain-containing protein [Cyathus striatus]